MTIPVYIVFAILVLVIVSNILISYAVYRNDRKSVTNIVFVALATVTSIWLVVAYISTNTTSPELYLFWSRVTIFFATAQAFSFFLLAHVIPKNKLEHASVSLKLVFFCTFLVMILSLTPAVFSGVNHVEGSSTLSVGWGIPFFVGLTSFLSIGAIVLLFRKIKRAEGVEKRQLELMMLGILLMLGLIISTIMIPIVFFNNDGFLPFAPLYTFVYLGASAIAIMKYKLFNLKVVATEALVTILLLVLLLQAFLSESREEIIAKLLFAILAGGLGILVVKSVYREVEEKKKVAHLASSLEKANLRLTELDRQKTEFLSIASHQLRTPLSIIKGYLELIKDGAYGKISKKAKNILTEMDQSNERLVKLVDEFLDISRIEQGRTKYSFKKVNLGDLVDSVVEEIKDRARSRRISIVWDRSDDPCEAVVDEERIRHVIFNFVDNATKYTEGGWIKVSLEKKDGGYQFKTVDSGIGFEKEDEANFFTKFFRGRNVEHTNVNGTGLGLYVCKKFIDAHRGTVQAKSEGLGKGSEFSFWLPSRLS